jgi:hypothetical protein
MADLVNLKMTRQYFEETTYSKKSLPDGALRAENFLTIERFLNFKLLIKRGKRVI